VRDGACRTPRRADADGPARQAHGVAHFGSWPRSGRAFRTRHRARGRRPRVSAGPAWWCRFSNCTPIVFSSQATCLVTVALDSGRAAAPRARSLPPRATTENTCRQRRRFHRVDGGTRPGPCAARSMNDDAGILAPPGRAACGLSQAYGWRSSSQGHKAVEHRGSGLLGRAVARACSACTCAAAPIAARPPAPPASSCAMARRTTWLRRRSGLAAAPGARLSRASEESSQAWASSGQSRVLCGRSAQPRGRQNDAPRAAVPAVGAMPRLAASTPCPTTDAALIPPAPGIDQVQVGCRWPTTDSAPGRSHIVTT